MKVRNKKTGEVKELQNIISDMIDNHIVPTLIAIENEWEDYEEPKESEYYWYIGYKNDIRRTKYHHISDFADNQVTATRKEIGNCFGSLEEAEKAVEKLKAWKRLKDGGFTIRQWRHTPDMNLTVGSYINIKGFIPEVVKNMKDLDLLFGGEE